MQIVLKKIEYLASMSEETHCFSAQVWIDGVHAFDASNHGHGGGTMFRERGALTQTQANEAIQADPANFPPLEGLEGYPEIPADLEIVTDRLLEDWIAAKELRRALASNAMYFEDGKLYSFRAKGRKSCDILPQLRAKYPGRAFLNDMPFPDALAAYRSGLTP